MMPVHVAEREAIARFRDFADAEIRPRDEWTRPAFPREVSESWGSSLPGVLFPEEYGGAALPTATTWRSSRSSRRWMRPSPSRSRPILLGSNHIFQFGTEAQRRRYIPKLASCEWLAAGA